MFPNAGTAPNAVGSARFGQKTAFYSNQFRLDALRFNGSNLASNHSVIELISSIEMISYRSDELMLTLG